MISRYNNNDVGVGCCFCCCCCCLGLRHRAWGPTPCGYMCARVCVFFVMCWRSGEYMASLWPLLCNNGHHARNNDAHITISAFADRHRATDTGLWGVKSTRAITLTFVARSSFFVHPKHREAPLRNHCEHRRHRKPEISRSQDCISNRGDYAKPKGTKTGIAAAAAAFGGEFPKCCCCCENGQEFPAMAGNSRLIKRHQSASSGTDRLYGSSFSFPEPSTSFYPIAT